MERREIWFTAPRRVEVRRGAPPREVGAGEIRARALASGISQGTELLLYRGEGPAQFDPSIDAPGAATYPRRYGYAWVGEVVDSGSTTTLPGTHVFALAPHGDDHVLVAAETSVVPGTIPAMRAVLAAALETAITVVWDGEIGLGDDVRVIGGGVIGLLSGWLARRAGAARVTLVEPSVRRRSAARALGIDHVIDPHDADARNATGAGSDVVIEASGDPTTLASAIDHTAREGRIVIASFYGERTSPVPLGDAFHRRRLSLRASQVSTIPQARGARWDRARRFALVLRLLEEPTLDALIDPPVSVDDAAAVYARLAAEPGNALQTVFRY